MTAPSTPNDATNYSKNYSEALLPCPFCGGEAAATEMFFDMEVMREEGWPHSVRHGVSCSSCDANNCGISGNETPERAQVSWNQRVDRPSTREMQEGGA